MGRELLDSAELVFLYWRQLQARTIGRAEFVRLVSAVRDGVKNRNDEIQDAAIRALAGWPNDAPLDDLKQLAKKAKSDTHKILALRGFLAMLEMPGKRS